MTFTKARLARLLSKLPLSSRYFGPPRAYAPNLMALRPAEGKVLQELRPEREVFHPIPRLEAYPEMETQLRTRFSPKVAPAQRLYQLSQARVLGEAGGHGLITNQDRFILDQCENWGQPIDNHPVHYALKLPRCSRMRGTTFSLISHWSNNYWHWLFDVLGKLVLLRETGASCLPRIDQYLVINLSRCPFKLNSLRQLGLDSSQLVDVARDSQILCDQLVLADRPHRDPLPEKDLIDSLRRSFLSQGAIGGGTRRIYISRQMAGTRLVTNEIELMAGLKRFGFECICLEEMDFIDQVKLFQSASAVLAPHGAGLSNLVFCAPGTKVFDLHPTGDVNPCFGLLCEKLSLSYTMWSGKEAPQLDQGNLAHASNTSVDLEAILEMVFHALPSRV